MDTNALNELIAKARETAASLAQAEQRVAAFSANSPNSQSSKPSLCDRSSRFLSGIRVGTGNEEAAQGLLIRPILRCPRL
jgi:hypothetical protein